MKWFKHQSDARNSLKLRKVRRKYGAEGYAVYWFCLEAISYDVDKDNLTFELKEDAETIGFELDIQERRVEKIMVYMISIGLFEQGENCVTCFNLAESIDKSMTNSPKMRKWLEVKSDESVMTCADGVKTCAELEVEVEVEKKRKEDLKDFAQKENCAALIEQGFNIFYSAGLVKKSKKRSFDKFKLLVRDMKADPIELGELLKTDIQARIANQQFGIDGLHPATYLNQQRWEDDNEKTDNGLNAQPRKLSAVERVTQRNEQRYGGQDGSGLGVGENGGDLRGAVDQGEWRGAIIDVESSPEQTTDASDQGWDC